MEFKRAICSLRKPSNIELRKQPNIIALQETNFKDNHAYSLKGFNCFHKNRQHYDKASGGVAIYTKQDIPTKEVKLNTDLEAVAVTVTLKQKLNICYIYLPKNIQLHADDLHHLIEQIQPPRLLIIGDFNAHNIILGSKTTDRRGKQIEEFLDVKALVLLNNGENTRFNSYTGTFSTIDLTFCDPQLAPFFKWQPFAHLYGSDHFPIEISAETLCLGYNNTTKTPKWNIKHADWTKYTSFLSNKLQNIPFNETIENQLAFLVNTTTEAAEKSIGKTEHRADQKSVPWWNPE